MLDFVLYLDSSQETFYQIHLKFNHFLGGEASGVAFSAVVYPGLDVLADVELSLLEVVVEGKARRTVPVESDM